MISIVYRYIATRFLKYIAMCFLGSSFIVMLFDVIEVARLSAKINDITFDLVFFIAALKNYSHFNKIWVFIILLSSILTYRSLSMSSELYSFRSAGISTTQTLYPVIIISILIGIIHFSLISPIGSYLLKGYQGMEAIYFKGKKSSINLNKSGIWLKHVEGETTIILHALRVSQIESSLYDVSVYYTDRNGAFLKRIDSHKAIAKERNLELQNAHTVTDDYQISSRNNIVIPISKTFQEITDAVMPPEIISFWDLSNFIEQAQKSGFGVVKHRLYFLTLVMCPVLFSVTSIIGYAFGVGLPRFAKYEVYACVAIIIEFILYFLTDFISALSLSGSLPIYTAPIFQICITLIIAVYVILHNEF